MTRERWASAASLVTLYADTNGNGALERRHGHTGGDDDDRPGRQLSLRRTVTAGRDLLRDRHDPRVSLAELHAHDRHGLPLRRRDRPAAAYLTADFGFASTSPTYSHQGPGVARRRRDDVLDGAESGSSPG